MYTFNCSSFSLIRVKKKIPISLWCLALKCVGSICVLESLFILNWSTVSIIGHCNRWGLRAVQFCSFDEGAHGSHSNFEDRDQVIESRPAERETLSEGRDTGDSWCIGPEPGSIGGESLVIGRESGGIGGESGGEWRVEKDEERDGVTIQSIRQEESTYVTDSSGRRFTLTFTFLFWQQN